MFDQLYFEPISLERHAETGRRCLPFSGAKNFRDLGGYTSNDGRSVRWNVLYRSDALHKLTNNDLRYLSALMIERVVDFRSAREKEREPDRLPEDMNALTVAIPILDASTRAWHESGGNFEQRLKTLNPAEIMIQANVELASRFTPEIQRFLHELFSANGRPVLFHCAAGKDRTGFAAAILLRILGVPMNVVMEDYLLSNRYYLNAHRWDIGLLRLIKGKELAAVVQGFMQAHPSYLMAAFNAIDRAYGSFEEYLRRGLELEEKDIERFKTLYLE